MIRRLLGLLNTSRIANQVPRPAMHRTRRVASGPSAASLSMQSMAVFPLPTTTMRPGDSCGYRISACISAEATSPGISECSRASTSGPKDSGRFGWRSKPLPLIILSAVTATSAAPWTSARATNDTFVSAVTV